MNPFFYTSALLGCIGFFTPTSLEALKEQAIRTHLEGREDKLQHQHDTTYIASVPLAYRAVYDENKILPNEVINDQVKKLIGLPTSKEVANAAKTEIGLSAVLIKEEPNNTINLQDEYTKLKEIEKDCLALIPSLEDKAWFQKFQSNLEKIKTKLNNLS